MNTKDNQLIKLVEELQKNENIKMPEWGKFVKTGVSKERPPELSNWWFIRAGSILRKVQKSNPIGTNKLAKKYSGRKNMGMRPEKRKIGSRNITRKILQQLEMAGFIQSQKSPLKAGKILTRKGNEILKKTREVNN
jgi:small subunit ribosomal protein S19e